MDQQQLSAQAVAEYLDRLGFLVHFPGLLTHPGKETHDKHARGPGAVLSFTTGDKALSERIVAATRLWGISVSFGCVNSLISMPCLMSHASIDPAIRAARNLPEDLIRLCVGIEDTEDLIDDLEAALLEAGAIRSIEDANGEHILERTNRSLAIFENAFSRSRSAPAQDVSSLVISAPGKIILFGEHAVVHGHVSYLLSSRRKGVISIYRWPLLEHSDYDAIASSNLEAMTRFLFLYPTFRWIKNGI